LLAAGKGYADHCLEMWGILTRLRCDSRHDLCQSKRDEDEIMGRGAIVSFDIDKYVYIIGSP
jgi:hypothetical protein